MHASDYPYVGQQGECKYKEDAPQVKINGYARIFPFLEFVLQYEVAHAGPIAASMHRLPSYDAYTGGIYFDEKCSEDPKDANHHVTVVGYGSQGEEDFWIVKDSRGPAFGEEGYVRIARGRSTACGLTQTAFYPLFLAP